DASRGFAAVKPRTACTGASVWVTLPYKASEPFVGALHWKNSSKAHQGASMTASHDSRNFFLEGPAGRLEAILWTPAAATRHRPSLAAVVCHPHPLYGGTMHNKVVYQAAKSLDALGLPVLRFNFRGAGLSAGKHDRGIGEQEDVRAALDFLAKQFTG